MTIRFNSDHSWSPRGRGFNMGVVQPEGKVIHFTGQVAWDANENIVGRYDVGEQTRQCFRNIIHILNEVGGIPDDLISITTYFLDLAHLPDIQAVRNEFLSVEHAPVSTSIKVAGLGHEDFLVELTPIAVVPLSRFRLPTNE